MNKQTSNQPFVFEPFELPVFEVPQQEHWPAPISWDQAMEAFDAARRQYLAQFDSPEERLRQKNPMPFQMTSSLPQNP